MKEVRKLFNELKSNYSYKAIKEIRKKLYKKETVYNFLKEKEQKGSLTNTQTRALKNIDRYIKKFKKDLEKLKNINTILHMAWIIYLMNLMKIIMNQKKLRVL